MLGKAVDAQAGTSDDRTERPAGRRRLRVTRTVAWVLLVGWLVVLASAWFLGERHATLGDLEDGISHGRVDEVRMTPGLDEGARGYAVLEVRWRDGLQAYSAQVGEASSTRTARAAARQPGVSLVLTDESLVERLRLLEPDLGVETTDHFSGLSVEIWGRELRGGLVWGPLVLSLGTLALLVAGPEPWRATRWAWFWLLTSGLAPFTAVAFLVAGGTTRLIGQPAEGQRRLTGGWAFLICSFITGVIVQSRS